MTFNKRSLRSFLLVATVAAGSLFVSAAPATSYSICNHYGNCTICDFYGPNGEYHGYLEWCS